MIKWLTIPDETKRNAYEQIAEKTGMSAFAVEKDWWVVQTLSVITNMEVAPYLVFKGGTSLSKVWKLIERFSEDIDLAIDRALFGFDGNDLSPKEIDTLRKNTGRFIDNDFLPALKAGFAKRGLTGVNIELVPGKRSDRDRQIIIEYPFVIPPPASEYIHPRVQVEFSCRSLMEPATIQSFNALLDEHYPKADFTNPPITVNTVNPERTFLEKIFLLHEEFHKPAERVRSGDRLSRHLYDVVKIARTPFAELALNDQELYSTIVAHRQKFNTVPKVNYNFHQPPTINPLPISEVIHLWKADYDIMLLEMIYEENPPSFDEIISNLTTLKESINQLPWQFPMHFPTPDS